MAGGAPDAGTAFTRVWRRETRPYLEADHIALNGVDRWIGGLHLHSRHPRWRWDEGTEAVTTTT